MTEREIFIAAAQIHSPAARSSFLDQACAGDAVLHERIDALLAEQQNLGSYLEVPAAAGITLASPSRSNESAGTRIGPYKLLQPLGEGGMGAVYLAEQHEPVKRLVALKIIKAGMDSAQVIARFEQERQALAIMDHPHIAKVLDAGTTDSGRPYFVMELVKGIPITRYCDQEHLTPKERLELFIPVCQAVQHAHQKGIIHRDLKPSNVLIALYDGRPVPKVIDFGVAKATSQKLTERTLFTEVGSIVGTLEYMAPEQAELNNLDIDTRADIYSLGVLLYELLTGAPPFSAQQLKSAGFNEMLRIIKEVEPPKPSTKLSSSAELPSIAANRKLEPARLTKLVRGDLDWIVMRCLEKERARRYETANAFALDIQRYLHDEPVLAGPPSTAYRLKKFLRRNKVPTLAAAVLLLTLLGGIIGTTWGLIRAENSRLSEVEQRKLAQAAEATAQTNERRAAAERDRAEQEKRVAQAVKDFLQNRLLNQADAYSQGEALLRAGSTSAAIKDNPTIRELLDRAAAELTPEKIETQFPNLPIVQAEILKTIGDAYRGIGEYNAAIAHLERSRELFATHLGLDNAITLVTMHNLAWSYKEAWKYAKAIELYEQVRDRQIAFLGPDHLDTLNTLHNLADVYQYADRIPDSIQLFEQVRDKRLAILGPNHPDTLTTQDYLGHAYGMAGRNREATRIYEQVRDKYMLLFGLQHPATLHILAVLAEEYAIATRFTEAIALYEQVRDRRIATLGPDHPHTLTTIHHLGIACLNAGKVSEAIRYIEEVLEKREKLGRGDHPSTLIAMTNLARAYAAAGRLPEANELTERSHERRTASGLRLLNEQQFADAELVLKPYLTTPKAFIADHWLPFYGKSLLGAALAGQKKYEDAEPLLLAGYEGLKGREAKIPANFRTPRLTAALHRLIDLYTAWDKPDQAAQWRALAEKEQPTEKPLVEPAEKALP
jgi:serine/threonine protein kinase